MIIFLFVILLIIGHFYYTVYTSEYTRKIPLKPEQQISTVKSFKIGTYNIKSLNYDKNNLEGFNKDIQDLNLDIICLQEVDLKAYRSGRIDMLKDMAKENGFSYYHFYSSMWIVSGYYGLGILSKYPIKEVSSKRLPNSVFKEPRILTKTTIRINNEDLDIYNTHLTYENNHLRIQQMDTVKKNVDFKKHTILTGDFNSFWMNKDFNIEGINSINRDHLYTTFKDFAYPDDIFYSHDFKVMNTGLKMTSFSDHNLLYAEFEFY